MHTSKEFMWTIYLSQWNKQALWFIVVNEPLVNPCVYCLQAQGWYASEKGQLKLTKHKTVTNQQVKLIRLIKQ